MITKIVALCAGGSIALAAAVGGVSAVNGSPSVQPAGSYTTYADD